MGDTSGPTRSVDDFWNDSPRWKCAEVCESGSEKQREILQTTIVNHEVTGIPFNKFQPHDDWQPEPPKPQVAEPKRVKETETDRFPLPHQRERRLTPGEVASIKAMRANPHIPDDAKPPLPEGYE